MLLTTHNMEEADSLCTRIGIMDHGRILALDTPGRLKETIGADTIITVTADGDLEALAARMRQEVSGVQSAIKRGGTVQLAVRGGDRVLLRVIESADRGGFAVHDVQVAEPNLETVFINLTGRSSGNDRGHNDAACRDGAPRAPAAAIVARLVADRIRRAAPARPRRAEETLA